MHFGEEEDQTVNVHHHFAHPNLQSVAEESRDTGEEEEEEPPSCMNYFHYIDDKYLRPCFVHKYKKLKKMNMEVNFDDVLEGYKIMQENIETESVEGEDEAEDEVH